MIKLALIFQLAFFFIVGAFINKGVDQYIEFKCKEAEASATISVLSKLPISALGDLPVGEKDI